jgi:hypothetical protein
VISRNKIEDAIATGEVAELDEKLKRLVVGYKDPSALSAEAAIPMRAKLEARTAGLLYAIVIIFGAFAELGVRARLVVAGDPAATARNILEHLILFRAGLAAEVFYLICNVPLIFILYRLFRVVNPRVALAGAIFGLLSTAVEAVSVLGHYAPIAILTGAEYREAFTAAQLQAASYLSLRLFEGGFAVSLVFFGFDCLALSYLIVKSTFFPRIIGAALAIEGVGYLVNSFALLLAPVLQARIFPYFTLTALAEVCFALWLLVMGIDEPRWREQADNAGLSA